MGRSARWLGAGLACVCASAAVPAWGQVGLGVGLNRPSAEGPSSYIGRVGGNYTRFDPLSVTRPIDVAGMGRPATSALGIPSRSQYGHGGGMSEPTPLRLGPIYSPYRGSLVAAYDSVLMNAGALSNAHLASASGLNRATRLDVPLEGWPGADVPLLSSAPLCAPQPPQGSRFARTLGLKPAEESATPARAMEEVKFQTVWTAMENATEAKLARSLDEARQLFREATASGLDFTARISRLRQVHALAANVQNLDRESSRTCLLLALTAFERDQAREALRNLVLLATRSPEAFRDGEKPASLYGDYDEQTGRSVHFEDQMRRFARGTGEGTPEFLVLEAYCSWCLGDTMRARAALDKSAEALKAKDAERGEIQRLINALRYAL